MSEIDRGIGSEGLEQGGPSLGNDYSRKDLGIRDAGDALTNPNTQELATQEDTLGMDEESSRNLSGEPENGEDLDDDVDDVDVDEDDDELLDIDEDEEEDDELDKGL